MEQATLVRHYQRFHRKRHQEQLDWFRNQPSIEAAIEFAALSVDWRGKRFSHQRRIGRQALLAAKEALLSAVISLQGCSNFDELIELVEAVLDPIDGLGELYVYDISLRIGARLGILPQRVYLHAGTRTGAKVLGLDPRARAIEVQSLPEPLRQLSAHEVEDVLCIYKDELMQRSDQQEDLTRRSSGRC